MFRICEHQITLSVYVVVTHNKTGTFQVSAPLKAEKAQSFSNMLRDFSQLKTHMKVSKHPKVLCWEEWVRLFSDLRLIFSA